MAVYTKVDDREVESFLRHWGLGPLLALEGIAEGVENTNYRVTTARGRFILTLYEKRVARAELPFFLDLMEHLARQGIHCPTPLLNSAGAKLGELAGRPAAIFTLLEGTWLRAPESQHCHAVGRALAQLHAAGKGFAMHRPNALGLRGWRPLYERFAGHADDIAPGLAATIEHALAGLERDWPRDLPSGVIHADLFPDNVFFRDGRLSGLIDFYFACNDAYAYDIAICLNAWCFTTAVVFEPVKGHELLAGYETVRRLEPAERAALPLLARGAALRFLLTRAHDWLDTPATALVAPHDPLPYLERLRFHASAENAGFHGLGADVA